MLANFFDGRHQVVGVVPHLAHVGEDVDLSHGVVVATLGHFQQHNLYNDCSKKLELFTFSVNKIWFVNRSSFLMLSQKYLVVEIWTKLKQVEW